MSDEPRVSFKFSELYQDAIVGYMMMDYAFFLRCKLMIKPEWFTNPFNNEIVKHTFAVYEAMDVKRTPTMAEVSSSLWNIHSVDKPTYDRYSGQIVKANLTTKNIGLDLLCQNMTGWIRLIKLRHSMIEAEQKYNKGAFNETIAWLKDKMQEIEQSTFIKDESHDFSNPMEFYKERAKQFDNCLTTGHPEFDELLIKGAKKPVTAVGYDPNNIATQTKGGLAPGDTTILLGSTNSGKTSTVITIIAANLMMKKRVLYITHEQKREDIANRLYQSLSGLQGDALSNLGLNPENMKRAQGAVEMLKNLTYISYNKPGEMFVENVMSKIEMCQEEMVAKTGKGYDLLVDDYPGKLKSNHFQYKKSSGWEEQNHVYDQFVNAAEHHRFHAILPVQANREGFKVNRGDGNRVLDAADGSQSYGIMTIASNIITINRSIEDSGRHTIKFFIAKCRSAEPNYGFISHTAFDICRTHGFGLNGFIVAPEKISQMDILAKDIAEEIGRQKFVKRDPLDGGLVGLPQQATQVTLQPAQPIQPSAIDGSLIPALPPGTPIMTPTVITGHPQPLPPQENSTTQITTTIDSIQSLYDKFASNPKK